MGEQDLERLSADHTIQGATEALSRMAGAREVNRFRATSGLAADRNVEFWREAHFPVPIPQAVEP